MSARRRQSGFSAIEALAALAIVAVALVPLASLQTQITRGYARQSEIEAVATLQANAIAMLREVNPAVEPVGFRQLGENQQVRWRAAPMSGWRRTTRAGRGDGDFDVQVYRLDITVENGAVRHTFEVEQLGWRALDHSSR